MKPIKIFISGVSGTGKTRLAKHISEKYDIPFISTSGKTIWREFGIRSHQDIIIESVKDPVFALAYQNRLLEHRDDILRNRKLFVTDRGPLDNLLYFTTQVASHVDNSISNKYSEKCLLMQQKYCDIQIYLRLSRDIPLEDDGMRITSRLYQQGMDSVLRGILDRHHNFLYSQIRTINVWDFEKRVSIVENIIWEYNL